MLVSSEAPSPVCLISSLRLSVWRFTPFSWEYRTTICKFLPIWKRLLTSYLYCLLFCPHRTFWLVRKSPAERSLPRCGPCSQPNHRLPAALVPSEMAKTLCLTRRRKAVFSRPWERTGPFLRKGNRRGRSRSPTAPPGSGLLPVAGRVPAPPRTQSLASVPCGERRGQCQQEPREQWVELTFFSSSVS